MVTCCFPCNDIGVVCVKFAFDMAVEEYAALVFVVIPAVPPKPSVEVTAQDVVPEAVHPERVVGSAIEVNKFVGL